MGGGGKGTTTTTQTMQIPPEVMARYNAVNARADKTAQQPFQAYSNNANAFVAPLTPTQQAGIQNTNIMAGAAQPFYQAGAGLTAQGAQSVNPQALNIGQFYNPYTQAVAAPTLQALQQQQAVERSSLVNPQTAKSFGGDRSGIVQANLNRQQDLATAQAIAPIYQNAFQQALGAAQQQQGVGLAAEQANANRALQAGAQFGQLGTGAQQAGLAGAQAQLGAGTTEQQTQQAGLQALYNQWQQQQAYPFQIAQFLANIAMGTGSLSGNTTTSVQQGGGGFFSSDERLKENIEKVGKTNDGQNIYRYNYKGDPRTQIGLLAQEVAHKHPDAVGQAGGYLTVNYRDATDDAVRDHKADGGSEIGTSAYNISAPSAMITGPNIGLGALELPKMVGGGGLPIQAGAINPASQGLLAPKATGYSLGTKEGAEAELASLKGADIGKSQSGGEYFHQRTKALEDFLNDYNQNSSQGGLVASPGAFARGGYAYGGAPDMSAILAAIQQAGAYYGGQGGQGKTAGSLYGTPVQIGQYQMARGADIKPVQQKSGIEQANQIANLTAKGAELYKGLKPEDKKEEKKVDKDNPTNVGSTASYTKDANGKITSVNGSPVYSGPKIEGSASTPSQGLSPPSGFLSGSSNINADTSDDMLKYPDTFVSGGDFDFARGGLAGREHYNSQGYVNASGGLYGTGEDDDNALGKTLGQKLEHYTMAQPGKIASPQQASGLANTTHAVGALGSAKKLYDWGSKLASSGEAAAAPAGTAGVGSLTGAAAGEGALGASTLGAGAGELGSLTAAGAGLGEGLGAATLGTGAAAAEGAGLLGTLGAGAAAAGEGIMSVLPFLAFLSDRRAKHDVENVGRLNDGQPVYRFKYNGDNKTRMGLMAQDVEQDHPEAVKGLGGVKMVDYKKATNEAAGLAGRRHYQSAGVVPTLDEDGNPIVADEPSSKGDRLNLAPERERIAVPMVERAPTPPRDIPAKPRTIEAPSREEEPSGLGSFVSGAGNFVSGLGKKLAEKDETFWVPAIAGLGSMLASPNKTFLGALGSGLVGGTEAYGNLQKQTSDQLKQRFDIAKSRFKGPNLVTDEKGSRWVWEDSRYGDLIDQNEYQRRMNEFIGSTPTEVKSATTPTKTENAPAAASSAPVTTAKNVVSEPAPRLEPRKTVEPVASTTEENTTVVPAVPKLTAKEAAPALTQAAPSAAQIPAKDREVSPLTLQEDALKNDALWKDVDPSRNPRILLPQVAVLDQKIKKLEEQAQASTDLALKAGERSPDQAKIFQSQATNYQTQADRLRKDRDDKAAAAQKAIDAAVAFQVKAGETRTAKQVESQFELVETMLPDGSTVFKPKSQILQGDKPISAGAGSPTGEVAANSLPDNVKKLPESALKLRDKIGEEELKMADDYKRRQVASSRVTGLLDILTKYETGKFAEQKGDIIGKLNALGIKVDPTVSADPAKFEVFMKGAIKNVFDDLPGGKILLAEIAGLSKANANAGMQPAANAKILGDALAAIKYEDKYTLDYAKWRSEHPNAYSPMDTIRFNEEWLKNNNLNDYKKEVERTTGYVGQKLPANLNEAVHGKAYYLPEQKAVYFFDKNHKDASGKVIGGWTKTDPLAGGASQ